MDCYNDLDVEAIKLKVHRTVKVKHVTLLIKTQVNLLIKVTNQFETLVKEATTECHSNNLDESLEISGSCSRIDQWIRLISQIILS